MCFFPAMLQSISISQQGVITCICFSSFCDCHAGNAQIAWLWWPRGCVHESQRTVTIEETVLGRLTPQGTTQTFWVKETTLLVLELQPEGKASSSAHIYRPTEEISKNIGQWNAIFVLSLPHHSSPVSPKKELIYSWSHKISVSKFKDWHHFKLLFYI